MPLANNTFQKFAKIKYPTLSPASDEYQKLKHAYFVGMWSMMGFAEQMARHPGTVGDAMFKEIRSECEAELRPDKFININGINVPRTS